ncbi:wax ester/triacylglycerol synthase family O-acyltransferase [Pseudomarimonas salicorniae]|uniref:diacylglycerol O-acyltransferase n=1 Tax=Pseudomarimonas salicorniae TaxID=2933270 RepID=A0ABT0GLU5_9GAMM|nr:wax ester/triacylglycerol synthase family O-acyltransferase [Lysobacter sp. CAU 1642]MCK7595393.1 wax ester/triacylglycerol synthase family O-acyltransferase [Lysobacter sp. CAU 1642]
MSPPTRPPSEAAQRKALTGLDALFLYLESAGTPMHVGSAMLIDKPKGRRQFTASLRDHLIARLAPLPMLRWVLEEAPMALDHPSWRDGGEIDWQAHLRSSRLPSAGAAALARRLAELHAEPLDRDRPLWRIEIIDGLPKGQVALYMKSHHALVDGQAGVALTRALVDLEAGAGAAEGGAPDKASAPAGKSKRARLRASAAQLGRMLRGLPEGVRQIREGAASDWLGRLRDSVWLAPKTPFNRTIGEARRVGLVSLPLADLKRCAKGFGVSLNDVVMCVVADALRADLARRRCLPEDPLVAAMPVSLREPGKEGGNEVSMVQCPLGTDVADPVDRLHAIREATRAIKGRVSAFRGLIPTDFPGLGAPLWVSGLGQLWHRGRLTERLPALANLVISNVPGPPVPLFIGGAPIRHWYPLSIVTHGLGLNVTLLSYADSMEVGVVSAPECLARPETLCRGIERGLARLLKAVPG